MPNEQLEIAARRALSRYDNEDKGGLAARDGLAWAMAEDLRAALSPALKQEAGKCVKCGATLPANQLQNYRYCSTCYQKRANEWEPSVPTASEEE